MQLMVAMLVLSNGHAGNSANVSGMTVQLSLSSSFFLLEFRVRLFSMKEAEQAVFFAIMMLLFFNVFLVDCFVFFAMVLVK